MIQENDQDGEFDLPSFWRILQDLEDGSLDEFGRQEIMDLVESSREARMAYFEYFHQTAIFEMEGAKMSEAGRLPVLPGFDSSRRLFRRSLVAAAVITALLAIVATLIVVTPPPPGILQASVAAETRWYVDGVRQEPGRDGFEVVEGSTVRVASGVLELELDSGTKLVMQGPAKAAFPKLTKPVLEEGWLWVDSGDDDDGFAVMAGGVVIRDIGTRFGVRVCEDDSVEVHLIEGLIQIGNEMGGGAIQELKPSGKGVVVVPDERLREVELARDPFPELADLLSAAANFRTTILSQTPVGYWKFEEQESGVIRNEIENGGEIAHGTDVIPGIPGAGSQSRYRGFSEGNRALQFEGDPKKSVVVGLGGSAGVSGREGAVSFWLKTNPRVGGEQALWLAGIPEDGLMEPRRSLMHTSLTESGVVRFVVENGKDVLELRSGKAVTDGRWHQIAASWGPGKVDLFIDGKLVDREKAPDHTAGERMSGRFVRFGKPSFDLRNEGMESFKGSLDELAIWNRPLTKAEVLHQYESARDLPPD